MVFTQLNVITGVVLTDAEFKEHVVGEYVSTDDATYEVIEKPEDDIHMMTYPCCSENTDKVWIVGFKSYSYPRKRVFCGKAMDSDTPCGKYFHCDDCLGKFVGCEYNIEEVFNTVKTSPLTHFCTRCGTDNHTDFQVCKTCNYPIHHRYDGVKSTRKMKQLEKVLKAWRITRKPANIYMLDDCTSCS